MTVNSRLFVTTKVAEHRGAQFRAQADRYRLAKLAEGDGGSHRHQQWPDLIAAVAVVAALALVLAAGTAAAQESPQQTQQGFEQVEDQPDTNTVQKVREAAS